MNGCIDGTVTVSISLDDDNDIALLLTGCSFDTIVIVRYGCQCYLMDSAVFCVTGCCNNTIHIAAAAAAVIESNDHSIVLIKIG